MYYFCLCVMVQYQEWCNFIQIPVSHQKIYFLKRFIILIFYHSFGRFSLAHRNPWRSTIFRGVLKAWSQAKPNYGDNLTWLNFNDNPITQLLKGYHSAATSVGEHPLLKRTQLQSQMKKTSIWSKRYCRILHIFFRSQFKNWYGSLRKGLGQEKKSERLDLLARSTKRTTNNRTPETWDTIMDHRMCCWAAGNYEQVAWAIGKGIQDSTSTTVHFLFISITNVTMRECKYYSHHKRKCSLLWTSVLNFQEKYCDTSRKYWKIEIEIYFKLTFSFIDQVTNIDLKSIQWS